MAGETRDPTNMTKAVQMAKVREMTDIPDELRGRASKTVGDLTVRDLEDLALKLQGVTVSNKKVDRISFEDLETLEELFQGYKKAKFEKIQSAGSLANAARLEAFCDYTCCCCTPCCCCAAADVEPFAS